MDVVRDYKCLACGAGLRFDPSGQNWKCDYCRSIFVKEELDAYYLEKESREREKNKAKAEKKIEVELDTYFCKNCGAEIVGGQETIATFCLYCKSPTIIKGRMQGEFQPRYIIPFEIDQKAAKEIYGKWIKSHFLAPKAFKQEEEIEKIRGVYAPFWIYHADDIQVDVAGTGTTSFSYRVGKTEYVETSHYRVERGGLISYQNVPVDASEKMEDIAMKAIEPFNYQKMRDFSMDFMTGFFAERFDYNQEDLKESAKQRMSRFAIDKIQSTHQYETFQSEYENVQFREMGADYSLFPVYILTNLYQGEARQYIMNGQTGKIYGKVPVSKLKAFLVFLISSLIAWLLMGLGGVLFG